MNKLQLEAKKREQFGRQTKLLRAEGILPAVLYGEGIDNTSLQVNEKDFEKIFQGAGESSLIKLKINFSGSEGNSETKEVEVLIHDIYRDPISDKFLHIDFYHPSTKKDVTVEVPIIFKGQSPAVKDLSGTLLKEIQIIEVKGLVRDLPKEIEVDIEKLKNFDDRILVKDLVLPEGVVVLRDKEEIIALISAPKKEKEVEPKAEPEQSGGEKEGGAEGKEAEKKKEREKK